MRTCYGKLSKPAKSGSGVLNKNLTDREEWILQTFAFLEDHIVRIKGRAGVKVCEKCK